VAKNLLVRRDARLAMLETVREYANERLADDPGAHALAVRLAHWCQQLARDADPHLASADRITWLVILDAELPNVRDALSRLLAAGEAGLALELAGQLGEYWRHSRRRDEGLSWLERCLDGATTEASDRARAMALLWRGALTDPHQASDRRGQDFAAGLALFRACDDPVGIVSCLSHLAIGEATHGSLRLAADLADEAIAHAERAGDPRALGFALAAGTIAAEGQEATAARAKTTIAHLEAAGDLDGLAYLCIILGYGAIAGGRYENALDWLATGLRAAQELQDPFAVFTVRTNQGLARLFSEQLHEAADAFCDALAVCRAAAAEELVDETLLGLAALEVARGDTGRAARLAGAAAAHETTVRSLDEDAVWARLHNEFLTPARRRHDTDGWDNAAREGAQLSVPEAIDFALAHRRWATSTRAATAYAAR
jgi:non-specific serine/threonine protein kinase